MLKSLKKKMKDQAGLTLIELLVVIVILGIIAAVAIPMVMSNKDQAEINANKQSLAILKDAVSRYNAVEGTATPATSALLVSEGYLESLPTCADGSAGFSVANGVVSSSCTGALTSSDETEED
ncbi:pilus assembly protein PilE [Bacillus sp. Y1]|nr:prepilin-type N-terminal cleavage/methylation domain-containing protein [Bacillus sp. Y1]AYA78269.1 pilus assembly protein PilE [Bacillus sp. Y1]